MICIPVDTRPTIIKVSPVVRELSKRGIPFFIAHTGQHYSYELDRIFFEQLGLPEPKYNLKIGSCSPAEQVGRAQMGLEQVFLKEKPSAVLIHGDANMVPAASIAAAKLGLLSVHKEAGLRSYNRKMPEEINRVIGDHVCDRLFTPTEHAKGKLLGEGIPSDRIFMTGNTIVDSVDFCIGLAERAQVDVPEDFILMTMHRAENVDDPVVLKTMVGALGKVAEELDVPIIWPIHPRSRERLKEFGLEASVNRIKGLRLLQPVGYFEFLKYLKHARLVLTDSGGVQEEACTLKVPCVTLRTETERSESVAVGANIVSGVSDPGKVLQCIMKMDGVPRKWANPFGDGKAAGRMVDLLSRMTG